MARITLASLALVLASSVPASADPVLVDAVLARVDGHPILLSALRPRLRRLEAEAGTPSYPHENGSRIEKLGWRSQPRGALELTAGSKAKRRQTDPSSRKRRARRALLERAIDEALIAARARQLSIRVSRADVDAALASVATQNGLDAAGIMAQAAAAGYSERDYRAELERQLVEQRVLLAEINRAGSRWPNDPKAASAWMETERKALLRRLRNDACIERRVRW